jgi:pimeloyl-ACP methyl ester carboxylesterase
VETEEVGFSGTGVRLSGTITCPDTASAPGVVLIGGSGPSDRHSDGLFDALREHLAGIGVAVLAYDKRGVGKSTGSWPSATVGELAQDAAAAVATLRAHPRVAADAVGVLGNSEGRWVALRLCAQPGAPQHLILNSCPAVSFAETAVFALTNAGVEPGVATALVRQVTEAVRAGHGHQQGQRILDAYRDEPWYAILRAGGFTLNGTVWSQLSAWGDHDPHDDLVRLKIPTLAIFGRSDPLVPVQASILRHDETAARTARPQQTVVFPDADHQLRTGTGFAPGYLTCLSDWCREQGAGGLVHRDGSGQ